MKLPQTSRSKGIVLLSTSVIVFSIMSVLVKSIPEINSVFTVFYRFLFSVSIMGALVLFKVFPLQFHRSPLLLLRGLTGGIGTYLFYLSIVKLGVGKGTVISYSYPVFAALFSALFLKEEVSMRKWGLILMAFIGILLLSANRIGNSMELGWFEVLALIGAIFSALSIVIVKKLHDTDSTYAIFFAQAIVGFWIFVGPSSTMGVEISWMQFAILFGIGVSAVAAQLMMTSAYKHVKVSTGASFYMLVPVLNLVIGYAFFNELLELQEFIGALIIISACFFIARLRTK